MKICIYGAGAVGGFLGVLLARAGHEVALIARGPHLAAMRANGVILETGGDTLRAEPVCTGDPADLGPQDYVILTAKAPALPDIAPRLAPLLGDDTAVVTAVNGIPWWFFHGFEGGGGRYRDLRLDSVDPGGALEAAIPVERVIGCVIHIAASVPEPGVIRHATGNRFVLGEPSGQTTGRCRRLAEAMAAAGLDAACTNAIQQEYWLKILGNMIFSPISMLTGATTARIAADPGVRDVCRRMMEEAIRVGRHFDLDPGMDVEPRIDMGGALGEFKPSMVQDLEKGRPVELDVIVKSVIEMGHIAGEPTPTIDLVFALAAQKAAVAGVYDG